MKNRILMMTQFAILLAIEALLCFTPLGSIPIGPIVATLAMLPVCITAILMGPGAGTLMGFFAALFSFIVWTFMPPNPLTAFVFTPFYSAGEFRGNAFSLLICFVPRILTGTVTGLLYNKMHSHFQRRETLNCALSAVVGSFVNTVGVLGGIWLFFGQSYESVAGAAMMALIGATVLTNSIPEAVVAGAACAAICKPVNAITRRAKP